MAMLKSARCIYVGRHRLYIASATIAGKRRRVTGSTFDGAFTVLAALSLTLTGCPPTSAPADAAETPDVREDDATNIDATYRDDAFSDDATNIDATYRDDAFSDDADELADVPSDDAAAFCEAPDVCPPGWSWTPCGCATDCVPPACGADQ